MTGLDAVIRAWFATRLEVMPCDDDIEAHESLQMAAHAVLAVLDAHAEDLLDPEARPHCRECSSIAGRRVWAPCSTKRLVAEKLGVEAQRD